MSIETGYLLCHKTCIVNRGKLALQCVLVGTTVRIGKVLFMKTHAPQCVYKLYPHPHSVPEDITCMECIFD